eukprot:Gb_11700 [translate_table: standard]
MADLKEPLLPPRPSAATDLEARSRPSIPGRSLFQGVDVLGFKKRGQGVKSWIRVGTNGMSQILEVDKFTIMRRCDLPARDLRLLDPLFDYPSTILGREKAIVVNLEQIRCIITADEVLLLNSIDSYVLQYVAELQRRLTTKSGMGGGKMWHPGTRSSTQDLKMDVISGIEQPPSQGGSMNYTDLFSGSSADNLPFEFRALEVALEAACTFLDSQDIVHKNDALVAAIYLLSTDGIE